MDIAFSRAGRILDRDEALNLAVNGNRVSVSPVDDQGIPWYGLGAEVKTASNGDGGRQAFVTYNTRKNDAELAAQVAYCIQVAAAFAADVDARLDAANA